MPEINEETLQAARVIWGFHVLGHKPVRAEIIIALGTHDLRVAEHAAELFRAGYGHTLVCTGSIAHQGDLLETPWDHTEAEMYADVAEAHGVPRDRILLETRATNTAENIRFSKALLEERGLDPAKIVLAVKPFMQRRTWATAAVHWPEVPGSLSSPPLSMDEYFTPDLPAEKVLHIMMGDLQRLYIYGRRGWSAPQIFPREVIDAYAYLKQEGWTQHLVNVSAEEDIR